MPKVGDVIAGKYVIEQLIGVGGMGAVFAASHKFTGKRVALKWMLPELAQDGDAVQRFMREAHAAGRISHPNVVDVYDVGQHDNSYFLVMEYLSGEPLTAALARRDLTPPDVLELLLPAMRGVGSAHRQGVVHRDLKPDNIFLAYEEDGLRRQPKVLDFGISKLSNEGTLDPRLTRTGAVVGTPYYMSPEQIRGLSGLDKRADVYAFGVILYEALTGRVPFHADTYGALVLEIATGTPRSPSELAPAVSAELSRIVLRAMARDPNQRYPDMESLIQAIEPFANFHASRSSSSRRPSGGHAVDLEATRIAAPVSLTPQVATVPHLASTPFASELTGKPRKLPPYAGPALFAGAAALIVTGIWIATSGPAQPPPPTEQVVMPTRPVVSPAAQPPAAPPVFPPAAILPVSPTPIAPPNGLSGANATQGSSETPGKRITNNSDNSESNPTTLRSKWSSRRKQSQHGSAQAEPSEPKPSSPSPQQPKKAARSGTLSVDEF